MTDFVVGSFAKGLDTRRVEACSPGGVLSKAKNVHINSGGEVEKRKAFVQKYVMAGASAGKTFGMAEINGALYVFGSGAAPAGIPAGVTYQRLQNGAANMTAVNGWDLYDGKLYVSASYDDGSTKHFYDGTIVAAWFDGKARGSFDVTGGTALAGTNKITSVKVNGVEILTTAVDWVTDNVTTAAAIATQINTTVSAPEYTAVSSGATVTIISTTAGTSVNGFVVVTTPAGTLTTGNIVNMQGGADNSPGDPGKTVKTFKQKLNTTTAKSLFFSKLGDATNFTDKTNGASYINLSTQSGGSTAVVGMVEYLKYLALFANGAILIWFLDVDPANNDLFQTIRNAGTTSSRSLINWNDSDAIFLGLDGVRALRPSPSIDNAYVAKIGAPIDKDVQAHLLTLSAVQIAGACAAVEPREGRMWMCVKNKVFVLSSFPDLGVYAWTIYEPGFDISDVVACQSTSKLYVRSGDTIYIYGGDNFDQYDTSEARARLPYLNADAPAELKTLLGIDFGGAGTWTVDVGTDPNDPTQVDEVATVKDCTFDQNAIPAPGVATHYAVELVNVLAEQAKISQFVLHYKEDLSE